MNTFTFINSPCPLFDEYENKGFEYSQELGFNYFPDSYKEDDVYYSEQAPIDFDQVINEREEEEEKPRKN